MTDLVQARGFEMPPAKNPQDSAGWVGWCLAWTRTGYTIPRGFPTAQEAWDGAKFRHADRAFPAGVAVPVFFRWGTQGHVAVRLPSGSIVSSPFKKGQGHYQYFASVDELARAIGATYLGWTEDLCGERVVTPATTGGGSSGALTTAGTKTIMKGAHVLVILKNTNPADKTRTLLNTITGEIAALKNNRHGQLAGRFFPVVEFVGKEKSGPDAVRQEVLELRDAYPAVYALPGGAAK